MVLLPALPPASMVGLPSAGCQYVSGPRVPAGSVMLAGVSWGSALITPALLTSAGQPPPPQQTELATRSLLANEVS